LRLRRIGELIEGIEKCGAAFMWDNFNRQPMNTAFFDTPHARVVSRETDDQSPYRALLGTRIQFSSYRRPQHIGGYDQVEVIGHEYDPCVECFLKDQAVRLEIGNGPLISVNGR
jgi:hypothetical protein